MEDSRHLTDVEALMWTLDADPHLSSAFANVSLFDRPPDPDRFRATMERAVRTVPRLRRRVEGGLAGLTPPRWVDDADLDLDEHVRHVVVDAPGDIRQLLDLATRTASAPFARDRPLWEFVLVEGLADGRGAMIQKLHHTITDGEGGVRMSVEFIDFERNAPPRPEPDPVAADAPGEAGAGGGWDPVGSLAELTRTPRDLVRQAVEGAADLVADPTKLAALPGDAAATARSLARQLGVTGEALSPLWRERTLERRLELLRVPLDAAKTTATALGGSVNDLFVAGATGGAGAYHRAFDVPVEELRMAMPVSTRTEKRAEGSGGNAFAPTRVRVPVDEDPRQRFREIHQRLGVTKQERAVGFASAVAGLGNLLPAPLLVRMVRQQTATVDFTTSNVRGAPFALYIAGAEILANHPIGPLAGTAWNLTTMSVNGSLDMGLHVDIGAVDEPVLLRTCIESAFDELLALT
ncbi:MAG TPA: wax ester/triacylglycerol synthase domain-containing protein [Iamia sp.]|nr:wax ester/triacylglycerol synthase domain-containing protein [Iamia sp.]